MALFAIGDLHLSFQTNKPMDQFGERWVNHTKKIKERFSAEVKEEDTLLLLGDHSWALKPEESVEDFEFIMALPGRKILTRGNHDLYWPSSGTTKIKKRYEGKLEFVQSQYISHYGDIALVGTKGYAWEGHDDYAHAQKLIAREIQRLRLGFLEAQKEGYTRYVMLLHYPPTNIIETRNHEESPFTKIADEFHVEQVLYAHCHGEQRWSDSLQGEFHGIPYHLVSGDYLDWHPYKVMD